MAKEESDKIEKLLAQYGRLQIQRETQIMAERKTVEQMRQVYAQIAKLEQEKKCQKKP